ncbi:hypothetical protein SAMN04488245_103185 [Alloyangia pacifica]|uniref:Tat pathway signal sequence domain protein n=1 Tax=Alloyangia pacifica TaxID=311180 RepID=A0A1I6RNH7_9RHOB|nr:hypothetical protein [Alloyangia pacifica]SDG53972.1 hypothetical protein SAMN04488245_103185 [Alloyangia pacifica]SFS66160.1 hypothetical protein SAMN04488050_103230 [Alloyangia pacifica]
MRILRMTLPILALLPLPVAAQDTGAAGTLSLELNTTKSVESGCQLSFLIQNGHDTDIDAAVYETVLLDTEGQVDRLTLFDFGALPAGRPRVRQFVVPGTGCDGLGQILINGANRCEAGGAESDLCTKGLELKSRSDVEVIG